MADHASTTTAPPVRRVPTDTAPARVLTSPMPGEILLGSDDTGGPVLRIPTTTTREDLRAVLVALADLLARLEPALDAIADALAPAPSPLLRRFDDVALTITPTADQVRAAYLSNGDRLPTNLRGGFGWAVIG